MDREKEFLQHYYDWIIKCLLRDNKLDVLAFFRFGCDLGIRQKELTGITWNQVQHPYIKAIEILKRREGEAIRTYPPLKITDATAESLSYIGTSEGKLFLKQPFYYICNIQESCGDIRFSGNDIRRMAMILNLTGRYDGILKG